MFDKILIYFKNKKVITNLRMEASTDNLNCFIHQLEYCIMIILLLSY